MILSTLLDVALCTLATVVVVGVLVIARVVGWGSW